MIHLFDMPLHITVIIRMVIYLVMIINFIIVDAIWVNILIRHHTLIRIEI